MSFTSHDGWMGPWVRRTPQCLAIVPRLRTSPSTSCDGFSRLDPAHLAPIWQSTADRFAFEKPLSTATTTPILDTQNWVEEGEHTTHKSRNHRLSIQTNMVQLLADPALSQAATPTLETVEGRGSMAAKNEAIMSREEHAQRAKELSTRRDQSKAPKRGWSMTEHRAEHDALHHGHEVAALIYRQAPIPENGPLHTPTAATSSAMTGQLAQIPRRPRLPPPRRSYSVTDKEPEPVAPGQPRPSSRMTILDLPSEMHYDLFDFLDPIDGVCLGLSHSKLYAIHRRKYGKVPLCSRYAGPNDMEWTWRGAGPLLRRSTQTGDGKGSRLDQLRVQGQVYCRKCGISRCELHRHLRDWMGDGYEYCEISKMYGKPAQPDAKKHYSMISPKHPHRCGRHGGKRTVVAAEGKAPRSLVEVAEKK